MKKLLICVLLYLSGYQLLLAGDSLTVAGIFGTSMFDVPTLSGIRWIPNKEAFTYFDNGTNDGRNIWICDARSGRRSLYVRREEVPGLLQERREKRFTLPAYIWAPDGETMLFNADNDLYLFDVQDRSLKQLTDDVAGERDPIFSPDGKRIAYLKNNNLYVLDLATLQEKQLTNDGNRDILIGRFDWVYEEEFSIRTGFQWSPDSRRIAFFRLDQSGEPDFPIVDFIPVHNTVQYQKYPKAGDPNALVSIGVVDVASGNIVWMHRTAGPDDYISRISWLPDSREVAITYLNRDQNHLELLFASVTTGLARTALSEDVADGWLQPERIPHFVPGKRRFLWLSEKDGYNNIYLYDFTGRQLKQLTRGGWDVEKIVKVTGEKVYFQAARPRIQKGHLFSVNLNGRHLKKLTREYGSHRVNLSSSGAYYVDTFSSFAQPTRQVLYAADGKQVAVLSDGAIEALADMRLAEIEFTRVPAIGGGADAFWIKPPDFDPQKKYPVLIYTYAGPGSHLVYDRWFGKRALWYTLLAQKGYLIFSVDGRGTANRGRAWKHAVYRRLGEVEIDDQIQAARYVRSLPFVDPNRIGIWGWSYGGYATVMCMLKGADVFRMGVAVAPVTDWRNYDTIYTERYMDQPDDNVDGYANSSAANFAHLLQGKLLLLHGSSDDNVHLANTLQLAEAFENEGVQFDLLIYPRKKHGIGGRKAQVHLYEAITRFILEEL